MRLVLLGPPGAGKGTLATTLKKSFDLLHISTGDILREEMKNETEIGNQIKELMDAGNLVSDELVSHLVRELLFQHKGEDCSFLLDGYPRTLQQAKDLDETLKELGQPLNFVIYLESSPSLIIKRLTGRRVCTKCGAVFHIKNRKPKVDGICDYCGHDELIQRKDDCEETIRHRMEVYLETIIPLMNYYDQQKKVRRVNSDRDPEQVQKDLLKFLDE